MVCHEASFETEEEGNGVEYDTRIVCEAGKARQLNVRCETEERSPHQ